MKIWGNEDINRGRCFVGSHDTVIVGVIGRIFLGGVGSGDRVSKGVSHDEVRVMWNSFNNVELQIEYQQLQTRSFAGLQFYLSDNNSHCRTLEIATKPHRRVSSDTRLDAGTSFDWVQFFWLPVIRVTTAFPSIRCSHVPFTVS